MPVDRVPPIYRPTPVDDLPMFAADPHWLREPRTKLERQFAEFHAANPHVADLFERYALEAWKAGARRVGAKAIAERIRWDQRVRVISDEWKINNSLVALYARLLIHRHTILADVIETRERQERDHAA